MHNNTQSNLESQSSFSETQTRIISNKYEFNKTPLIVSEPQSDLPTKRVRKTNELKNSFGCSHKYMNADISFDFENIKKKIEIQKDIKHNKSGPGHARLFSKTGYGSLFSPI